MPRSTCERITPELPRAPISEPWLKLVATASRSSWVPRPRPRLVQLDGLDSQRHVGPGVPVGDGVHVEAVESGPVLRQRVAIDAHNTSQVSGREAVLLVRSDMNTTGTGVAPSERGVTGSSPTPAPPELAAILSALWQRFAKFVVSTRQWV